MCEMPPLNELDVAFKYYEIIGYLKDFYWIMLSCFINFSFNVIINLHENQIIIPILAT